MDRSLWIFGILKFENDQKSYRKGFFGCEISEILDILRLDV